MRSISLVAVAAVVCLVAARAESASAQQTFFKPALHAIDFDRVGTIEGTRADGGGTILRKAGRQPKHLYGFLFGGLTARTQYTITVGGVQIAQFTTNSRGLGKAVGTVNLDIPTNFASAEVHLGDASGTVVLLAQRGGPTGKIKTKVAQ
jgi:hypothetical protein